MRCVIRRGPPSGARSTWSYPADANRAAVLPCPLRRAEGGAPRDVIVLIDGVEHFVGETIDLLPIMQDMTGLRRRIITNIGMKLNDGKFAGGNAPDQLALIEPARQHGLPRVERIQNERLAGHITEEQTFANGRSLLVGNKFSVSQERLLPSSVRI